jgi:hypothetical protein
MRRIRRPALCAGVVVALSLAAGCSSGGDDDDGLTDLVDRIADAAAADAEEDGESDDGAGSGSAGAPGAPAAGALPDDWPDQFPDPPAEAVFNGYLGAAADDRSEYMATYTLDDGQLDDVHSYYQDALTAAGWNLSEGLSVVSPVTAMTPFTGFDAEGSVTVQQDNSDAPVTITIIMHIQR